MAAVIAVSRTLGPEGLGQVAYVVWVAEFTRVLTGLGLPYTLTRHVADLHGRNRPDLARSLVKWVFSRYIFLVFAASSIIAPIAGFAEAVDRSRYLLLGVLLFTHGLDYLYQAYLDGCQHFKLRALVNTVASLCLVFGVTIGSNLGGTSGALLGYIAGATIPAALGLETLVRSSRDSVLPSKLRNQVWRYAVHAWVFYLVAGFSWSRVEVFFLELFSDLGQVGVFSACLSLSSLASQGPVMLLGALIPHFAQLSGAGDYKGIKNAFGSAMRLTSLMLFPLSFGAAAIAPITVSLFFGSEFSSAGPVAVLLSASTALVITFVGNSLLQGIGRSRFLMTSGFIGAGSSILAFLLLIPGWGSVGAAVARTAGQLAICTVVFLYIHRSLHCPFPAHAVVKTLAAGVLCGFAAHFPLLVSRHPTVLLVSIPLGAITYLLAVRQLNIMDPSDSSSIEVYLLKFPIFIRRPALAILRAMSKSV